MSNFERENRYIVIKRSDLKKVPVAYRGHLVDPMLSLLSHLPHRECLVVESDWPEYEPAWQMIERRMNGADPVPPAGGDVEVLGYSVKGNRYAIRLTKDELLELSENYTGPVLVELVDRAHVTRLQAEVRQLRQHKNDYMEAAEETGTALRAEVKLWKGRTTHLCHKQDAMKSELAKAQELLRNAWHVTPAWWAARNAFLSSQPVPADEAQGEPKPTGLSQGWNLTRKHDGFVIGHQSRSPDTKAIEQAERGGYVWVPFLVPDQPAPVAMVLPERKVGNPHNSHDWDEGYADGWAGYEAELKRLNQALDGAPASAVESWYAAADIDALVRELDVLLNGEGAAPQAKLCDLVAQVKRGLSAVRKNADRYLWLREKQTFIWLIQDWFPSDAEFTDVDAVIDAARSKGETP
ncbi:hypothetical protein GZ982_30195 (plasmid) [Pseudomonas fluorescens]|nr:hypothetical protein GZ982_30195 [Pseudomonas fluorescens]